MLKPLSIGGCVLGALPGAAVGIGVSFLNPWFLDCPVTWLLVCVLLPAVVVGRLLGKRLSGGRIAQGILVLEVLGILFVGWRPRPVIDEVDLLVVGLDGAADGVVESLIDAGETPNLERVRGGARAVLRSMEPMFSPILWTTMATGRLPVDHGIGGFRVSARDLQVPRFWDVAEAEGWRIGTWKWLVTYPPREVRGFQVPAWLAAGKEAWPEHLGFAKELELSNRIQRQHVQSSRSLGSLALYGARYGLRASTLMRAVAWKISEQIREPDRLERRARLEPLRLRIDRDAFVHATWRHRPDLATFTVYAIDALSHRFWQFHEPEAFEASVDRGLVDRYGEVVRDAYRQSDEVVGELMQLVGEDARLVLLSDHGFTAMGSGGHTLFAPMTRRLAERITEEVGPVEVARLGGRMVVSSATTDLEAVAAWLGALLDGNGEPFYRVEPLSTAAGSKLGLSLANTQVDAARLEADRVGDEPMSAYVRLDPEFTGDHHPEGIFWVTGPGISAQALPEMSLIDVAPTLYGLMGIPPAADLPGRDLLSDLGVGPATRNDLIGNERWLDGTEGIDEARLEALGYVE